MPRLRKVPCGRFVPTTLLLLGAMLAGGCGDGDVAAVPQASAWTETTRRPAEADDFAPLCVPFEGELSGEVVEFESEDTGSGVIVVSGSGTDESVTQLRERWEDAGSCNEDGLTVDRWDVEGA